jgi:hypothetical protein
VNFLLDLNEANAIRDTLLFLALKKELDMGKNSLIIRMLNDFRWVLSAIRVLKPHKNTNPLSIVTAADESHAFSLEQLLESILCFEPKAKVYVYDLGLEHTTLNYLCEKFKGYEFVEFPYSEYPEWMNVKCNAGNYGWKPQILHMVASRISGPILWLDSGNKLFSDLNFLSRIIQTYGFYSPTSAGNISDWTHPSTLRELKVNPTIFPKHNLNGAIIGFDSRVEKVSKLITSWAQNAMQLEVIAPEGSNRKNHRQDQALLGVLAHQMNLAPRGFKRHFSAKRLNILIHQDIEKYLRRS